MYTLAPEEKTSLVMAYTHNTLIRGDVVTKEGVRVNTWLRTQGVPEFMHLLKPQVLVFGCGSVKSLTYTEIYVPVSTVIAFHLVPPVAETMDYSEDEKNRVMAPVTVLLGTFVFKGNLRISSTAGISTSIEMAHSAWMSIYDVEVTNPYMPQMQIPRVPLILVNPKQVSLALEAA